jgi:hypothetical protein
MIQALIAMGLSLFFLGVTRLITHNWVAAILVAVFVLFFAIFGLGLTSAARYSDDMGTDQANYVTRREKVMPSSPRLAALKEPHTAPGNK